MAFPKVFSIAAALSGEELAEARANLPLWVPYGDVQEGVLTLKSEANVSPEVLETVVEYMYTGKLVVTTQSSWALYAAVHYLELEGATQQLVAFLCANVAPENALGMLEAAQRYGSAALEAKALEYVLAHFGEVALSEAWLERTEAEVPSRRPPREPRVL